MKPTIGRIVHYRSRTGKYTVPAIITATKETLNPEGVKGGFIEDLSSDTHVHLTVFTPGKPGKRATAKDFIGDRKNATISENIGGGSYQEWNVDFDDGSRKEGDDSEDQKPGTWTWPPRV